MSLIKEQFVKKWLSILAKVLGVLFLLYKFYGVFFGKEKDFQKENPSYTEKVDTIIRHIPDSSAMNRLSKSVGIKEVEQKAPVANPYVKLSHTIKYRGKPMGGAYFRIHGCESCKSTLSGKDGLVSINIPKSLYRDGLTHQFHVYSNDTLVYQKAMRFLNLQLDKY